MRGDDRRSLVLISSKVPAPDTPKPAKPKLLVQLSHAILARHYAARSELAYSLDSSIHSIYGNRPRRLACPELPLSDHLSTERRVSASTSNHALAALLFLYKGLAGSVRGSGPSFTPSAPAFTGVSRGRSLALLGRLAGPTRPLLLLYGGGCDSGMLRFESRTSILCERRFAFATARAERIASPCFPALSPARSANI